MTPIIGKQFLISEESRKLFNTLHILLNIPQTKRYHLFKTYPERGARPTNYIMWRQSIMGHLSIGG